MTTLVIRPLHQADKALALLQSRGIEGHVQPTLDIVSVPYDIATVDLSSIQAIVITSQNALHHITDHTLFHPFPLYCVGETTAKLALSLGYPYVQSADGDAMDLLTLIQQSCSPQTGSLLHLTCPEAPFPFVDQLSLAGYQAQNLMVYSSRLINNFTDVVHHHLHHGRYKNVMLFSPRSAAHFVYLCQFHQLENQISLVSAFCLSPAIAEAIKNIVWQNIFIAPKPKLNSLIDLLCTFKKS